MIRHARFLEVRFLTYRPGRGRKIDFEIKTSRGGERKDLSWTVPESLNGIFDHQEEVDQPEEPPIRDLRPWPGVTTRDLTGPASGPVEELGGKLFSALFSGADKELFAEVDHNDQDLVIMLSFDLRDPVHLRLYGLPWERLHDGKEFLQLNGRPIIRRLVTGRPVEEPELPCGGRLRILAAPLAAEHLDLQAEVTALKRIQHEAEHFELTVLEEPPTLAELARRLTKEEDVHVLHLMGHGHHDDEADAWGFKFADGFASSSEVARLLGSNVLRRLRLIVINTCHGGRATSPEEVARSTWDLGVAVGLVEKGARSVIANQGPISDVAAVELSTGFYDRVAAGEHPTHALRSTRGDLTRLKGGLPESDWSVPVHLVDAENSRPLFDPTAFGEQEQAPLQNEGRPAPPPIPRRSWIALIVLTAGALGLASVLATLLGHWKHFQVVAPVLLAAVGTLIRNLCKWYGNRRGEPTWTATLLFLASKASFALSLGTTVLMGAALFWVTIGPQRVAEIPCRSLVAPKEPANGWIGYRFPGSDEAQHQDRDMLRGPDTKFRWVLLDSAKGKALHSKGCLDFTLAGREIKTTSGQSVQLAIHRKGEAEPRTIQEPGTWISSRRSVLTPARGLLGLEDAAPVEPGAEIRQRLIEGFQLYKAGHLDEARAVWTAAVELDGDYAPLRQSLANVLIDLSRQAILRPDGAGVSYSASEAATGLLREAEQHLRWALRLADESADPEGSVYAFDLSRVYRWQARLHPSTAGSVESKLEMARQALEEAVRRDPTFSRALNNLAALLLDLDSGGAKRALQLLQRARIHIADDDHTLAAVLKNHARAHIFLGKPDDALDDLLRAECAVPGDSSGLRAEILGLQAELFGAFLGPAAAQVAWRRYSFVSGHDEDADPSRLQAFAESEMRRLSQMDRSRAHGWSESLEAIWRTPCRHRESGAQ